MKRRKTKHTAQILFCFLLDVEELIRKSKGKRIQKRSLISLQADTLDRREKTGFSYNRYRRVNLKYPVLITRNNALLDGRHRLCKMFDRGMKYANVIIMEDDEIFECAIRRMPIK